MATAPLAAPPRSQEQRRAHTRRALLDGTVAALAELGHARVTTSEICERAGVSQGALFKHFPSKAALIAAAAEHVFAELIARFRSGFARAAKGRDRLAAALDELEAVFESRAIEVAFELYVAARTDRELAEQLTPVVVRHAANLRAEAVALFPHATAHPDFDAILDVVVSALQGAALARSTSGADAARSDRRRILLELARPLFTPGASETAS